MCILLVLLEYLRLSWSELMVAAKANAAQANPDCTMDRLDGMCSMSRNIIPCVFVFWVFGFFWGFLTECVAYELMSQSGIKGWHYSWTA